MRQWLKELRLEKGLTQNEVAEKCNVERAYYTMIETGARNPSVNVAMSIAEALEFDWTIFFEHKCNVSKHKNTSSA